MIRKVIGFLMGFVGSFALIVALFASLDARPVGGPLWFLPMIAAGRWTSKLFSQPKGTAITAIAKVSHSTAGPREAVSSVWWSFDRRLRMVILISAIWVTVSYFMQDSYDTNYKVVFLPAMGIVALYLGQRFLVEQKQG